MMTMLDERMMSWIKQAVHPDARLQSIERLKGGASSRVSHVAVDVLGEERSFVLREFTNKEWLELEPDLARHEAECLRRASSTEGIAAPNVIAYDETGSECGQPAILMTHLEGRVVLEPDDMEAWTVRMARVLAGLHAGASPEGFLWTYAPYSDPAKLDVSGWSSCPDRWKLAVEILTRPQPAFVPRFIHRDYHPTNLLWVNGEVSGIVDWVNGCIGPAGVDVGHCRVNLAQLHGVEAADLFLASYLRYAGDSFVYDPYWDLISLVDYVYWGPEVYSGWVDLGFTSLTDELVKRRLDDYLNSLLT